MIKKIKLIRCPSYRYGIASVRVNTSFLPPLGLGLMTAHLRSKGLEVSQDDLDIKVHYDNYHGNHGDRLDLRTLLDESRILNHIQGRADTGLARFADRLLSKTDFHSVDLVGLSVPSEGTKVGLMASLLMAKHIKAKHPVPIVLGGDIWSRFADTKALGWFKQLHDSRLAEFAVWGPGELALAELIDCLNDRRDTAHIPGLIQFRDGGVVMNGRGERTSNIIPDFDGLPLDRYSCRIAEIPSDDDAPARGRKNCLILPVKFIFGCPHRCIFCSSSAENNFSAAKPSEAARCLQELSRRYNTRFFYFLVDTINFSNQYVTELCDELVSSKADILWSVTAHLGNLNETVIRKMREAGCIRLIFGCETASHRLSNYIKKGIDISNIPDLLRLSHKHNIWTAVEIIAGLPTEQDADIASTIDFLVRHHELIDEICLTPFYLAEGSLLRASPAQYGIQNIRPIDQFVNTSMHRMSYSQMLHKYAFDEVRGLDWERKKKQISSSYDAVRNKIDFFRLPFLENDREKMLFELSARHNDLNKIREEYRAGQKRMLLIPV